MQMTLNKASKIDIIRTFGNLNMLKILNSKFPSLGDLKEYYGLEQTEKVMSIVLLYLSASFDGALSVEDTQEISAEMTSSILANLSLEDMFFVCQKIKTSKVFGKLTINKVLSAMTEHFDNRCNEAEKLNYNKQLANSFGGDDRTSTQIDFEERNVYKKAMIDYAIKNPQIQPTDNGK